MKDNTHKYYTQRRKTNFQGFLRGLYALLHKDFCGLNHTLVWDTHTHTPESPHTQFSRDFHIKHNKHELNED